MRTVVLSPPEVAFADYRRDLLKPKQERRPPTLYNEQSFYRAFVKDLLAAKKEVIIHSPFVTKYRSEFFKRILGQLQRRNVAVFIFTRPLEEQDALRRFEVAAALRDYKDLGAWIMYKPGYIHQKVAIIDRELLWEGSLNILSQRESREMMRRIKNQDAAREVMTYLHLDHPVADGYRMQYERLCHGIVDGADRSKYYRRMLWIACAAIVIVSWLFLLLQVTMGPLHDIVAILRLLNTPMH